MTGVYPMANSGFAVRASLTNKVSMFQDPASSKEPFRVNEYHIVKFWSSTCWTVVIIDK